MSNDETPNTPIAAAGKRVVVIPISAIDVGRETSNRKGQPGKIKRLPIGKRVRVSPEDAQLYVAIGAARLPTEDEE